MRDAPWIENAERYGTDYVCYCRWGYWPGCEYYEENEEDEEDDT